MANVKKYIKNIIILIRNLRTKSLVYKDIYFLITINSYIFIMKNLFDIELYLFYNIT